MDNLQATYSPPVHSTITKRNNVASMTSVLQLAAHFQSLQTKLSTPPAPTGLRDLHKTANVRNGLAETVHLGPATA